MPDIEKFLESGKRREKRKSKTLEKDIEEAFVDYAEGKKCWPVKLIFLVGRGWPDRTVFCPGAGIFFVEFKRGKAEPTPLQAKVQRRLQLLGFNYIIANKIGIAEKYLDNFLNR
jgi:hypothetical protein